MTKGSTQWYRHMNEAILSNLIDCKKIWLVINVDRIGRQQELNHFKRIRYGSKTNPS